MLDTERAYHEIVIERTRKNSEQWQERTYLHTPGTAFGGVGELISDSDGATTRQVYTDGQGSTRLTVDGLTTQSWSYEAFGNLLTGSTEKVTHGYTGERFDPDTGLIYLRARDYDPSTGRFISMDEHPGSQRIPLTLNKYLYTNADPVNHIDPSGYMGIASIGAGMNISFSLNTTALVGYGGVLTNMGSRLLLAYGVAALNSSSSTLVNSRSKERARDELRNLVIAKTLARSRRASDTLYHYTDRAAAMEIMATQEMICGKKYKGRLGNGEYFPEGAYATDIEPWNPMTTQRILGNLFYGGSQNRDLTWFVTIDGYGFNPIYGSRSQYVKDCPFGDATPIEVYYFGPSLLDP